MRPAELDDVDRVAQPQRVIGQCSRCGYAVAVGTVGQARLLLDLHDCDDQMANLMDRYGAHMTQGRSPRQVDNAEWLIAIVAFLGGISVGIAVMRAILP